MVLLLCVFLCVTIAFIILIFSSARTFVTCSE